MTNRGEEPRSRAPEDDSSPGLERPYYAGPAPFDVESGPPLTSSSIDEFLDWAGTVPRANAEVIRRRIAQADDSQLVDALDRELHRLPIADLGRHLLLLSTIGERRSAASVDSLVSFIWREQGLFQPPEPSDETGTAGEGRSVLDFNSVVQARAAEMLSYIATQEARDATLDIAARHPSVAVRLAAIDAHLFNLGDSDDAVQELRTMLGPEAATLIGLPRLTADMDPVTFDARAAEFYELHPEELPPIPEVEVEMDGPDPRRWAHRPPEP